MSTLRISVAIATYNGALYLHEQLISIALQSRLPDEVIVCDDNSKDNTVDIIRENSYQYPFDIKIIENKYNIGYVNNFCKALKACTGDLIFICDQDDYWFPNKIEVIQRCFEENPRSFLVIHDVDFCTGDLKSIGQTKIDRMKYGFNLQRDYVVGMATAIKREFLDLCLPIPNNCYISYDKWLHDCARVIGGKAICNQVLALYRRHDSNVTMGKAVNAGFATNRLWLFWARFREPSSIKSAKLNSESPLALWLLRNRDILSEVYLFNDVFIDDLVLIENEKNIILLERQKILNLPRHRRFFRVLMLFLKGVYSKHFGFGSFVKDLLIK